MPDLPVLPGAVLELTAGLPDLSPELRLRSLEWGVLFSTTGGHSVSQIADLLGLPVAEVQASCHELLEQGLLRERALTYGEYLRTAAGESGGPKTLNEFLQTGAAWQGSSEDPVIPPKPMARVTEFNGANVDDPRSTDSFDATVTRAVPTISRSEVLAFSPLATPLASKAPASSDAPDRPSPSSQPAKITEIRPSDTTRPEKKVPRMSLRTLMGSIMNRAPDLSSGRLDVYRVFIRVDTELLRRNGITTLRFEEDRQIEDKELQEAIQDSLRATLDMECPADVFL